MNASKHCLISGCTRSIAGRGLCVNCYNVARKIVNNGTTCWEELVDLGLAEKPTRRSNTPFAVAFEEAKNKKSKSKLTKKQTKS
jgi:hypothetical protein